MNEPKPKAFESKQACQDWITEENVIASPHQIHGSKDDGKWMAIYMDERGVFGLIDAYNAVHLSEW